MNDDEFRDLPPRERRYEIQVADNLFFAVFPNGVKAWVLVYRFDGIVRRQTLGTFPDMGLARALREADKDPAPEPRDESAPQYDGRRWLAAVGLAAGLVLVAGAAYLAASRGSDNAGPELGAPVPPANTVTERAVAAHDASVVSEGSAEPATPPGAKTTTDAEVADGETTAAGRRGEADR